MNITFFAANDFSDVTEAIENLIGQMWGPCVAIASALTVIWGVYLGFKFWAASGDEQKKKSAKSAVISFVVGIIVIFVVAVGAPLLIGAMTQWMNDNTIASVLPNAAATLCNLL